MLSDWTALADALAGEWVPRPEQLPPSDDAWTVWLYMAGRGAGKTRSGAEAVRADVESGRCGRVGLIAPTSGDCRDVMLEGASGILTISPNATRPLYEPSKRRISWKNGAIATLYSAEEADRLRGPQHDLLWCDELAAWPNPQAVWDQAQFGLRVGKRPRAIVTTTPRPIKLLRDLLKRDGQDVRVTRGSTYSNREHLPKSFLAQMESLYAGSRIARQELNAELLDDTPGAIFSRDLIDAARLPASAAAYDMKRIVVAIDPAVSSHEESNLTGIIVAGIDWNDHGFVLEDLSGRYSPVEFATKAISALKRWQGDRIVAEVNQGGAMVESTLRAVDPNVPYRAVHASRGKSARAEPISACYEQHKVHHVGSFPELEDEMCTYSPNMPGGTSASSPDRMDALVWALTDLMITPQRPQFVFG